MRDGSDLSERSTKWWNEFSVVYSESNPAFGFAVFHRGLVEMALNLMFAHQLPISNKAIQDLLSDGSEILKLSESNLISSGFIPRRFRVAKVEPKREGLPRGSLFSATVLSTCNSFLSYDKGYRTKLIASLTAALLHESAPDVSDFFKRG